MEQKTIYQDILQFYVVLITFSFQFIIIFPIKYKKMTSYGYGMPSNYELQELRKRNRDLYQENITLKRSLEDLIKVNTELTQSIEEFNNANMAHQRNQNGQSVEDMQNKIDMLTMEVEMLRKDIDLGNKNNHQGPENDENIMMMIEELLESFKLMQNKYEAQISELYEQVQNSKSQWQGMIQTMQCKCQEKLKNLQHLAKQLKKKDELVDIIQKKLRNFEQMNNNAFRSRQNSLDPSIIGEIKKHYESELEQRDAKIKAFEILIEKLKVKLLEKY